MRPRAPQQQAPPPLAPARQRVRVFSVWSKPWQRVRAAQQSRHQGQQSPSIVHSPPNVESRRKVRELSGQWELRERSLSLPRIANILMNPPQLVLAPQSPAVVPGLCSRNGCAGMESGYEPAKSKGRGVRWWSAWAPARCGGGPVTTRQAHVLAVRSHQVLRSLPTAWTAPPLWLSAAAAPLLPRAAHPAPPRRRQPPAVERRSRARRPHAQTRGALRRSARGGVVARDARAPPSGARA